MEKNRLRIYKTVYDKAPNNGSIFNLIHTIIHVELQQVHCH